MISSQPMSDAMADPAVVPAPAMHPFPHHYHAVASAGPEGEVSLDSGKLETLRILPPAEFGGPGDHWSPETLLVGALSNCFVLTYRAIARASKLPWVSLRCEVEGVLEREQGNSRFTSFIVDAHLVVPAGTDIELANRALHKAEQGCLISNSLLGVRQLNARVETLA